MSRTLTKREQEHVFMLVRRINHLNDRIKNYSGKSDSYDRAELSAVRWALKIVQDHLDAAGGAAAGGVGEAP